MTEERAPRILIVDDSRTKIALLRGILAEVPAQVVTADSGAEALQKITTDEFALFILDVDMPQMDGYELARRLTSSPAARNTPIIFVTAVYTDSMHRIRGYDAGAVDFLEDPVNPVVLRSKVRVFLELYQSRQRLRKEVAERQRQAERAEYQATHDPLTHLPNRLLFMDRLALALERGRRHQTGCALLYIDVDGFKAVNDDHGHLAGDELLRVIAQRLLDAVRREDTVARLGGDEFAVLLEQPQSEATAIQKAERIVESLGAPYTLQPSGGARVVAEVGASVGIARFPTHASTVDELMRMADAAMYRAKRAGKGRCEVASA